MTRRSYRFGDLRIDPVVRELWRGDELVSLPPHVFDCLAWLIEHRDRAVGRDELVAAVWGRTEISDTLLGQTLLRIRREVGDDGKDQRIVRTIPRFGYRWIAALEVDDADAGAEADVSGASVDDAPVPNVAVNQPAVALIATSAANTAIHRRRARIGAIVLAGVIVLAAIMAGRLRHATTPQPAPADAATTGLAISAAVVPAEIEAGSEWSWLRFSVMDVVATRLRTSGLPTVPSEDIIALLNTPASRRSGGLRDAAGFRLLVSPRVSPSGDDWSVHLHADDGAGQHYDTEAAAHDAAAAARLAADKLLVALGRQTPAEDGEATPYAGLVRRVDAAVLADDPDTARALIEHAPQAVQQSAELRLRLAKIDFRAGHIDAARQRLLGLLDESPAQAAPVQRAEILNGLGAVAIRSDQPRQAERFFSEAIDLLLTRSEPAQLGEAYLGRAGAAAGQRHFDAAAADYSRARIALRQANDTLALVRVAANEGFLDLDQGRPAQALPQLVAAGEGFRQWGALNEAVYTHIGQIACQLDLLEPAKAMDAADAATAMAARIDNQDTRDSLTIARARALAAVGRLREARAVLASVREADNAPGDVIAAVAAAPLARLELDAGNSAAAAQLAQSAVDTLTQADYVHSRARAWLTWVRALARMSNATAADVELGAFRTWADQTGDQRARLLAQLARAELAWRYGNGRSWRAQFDQAHALAERQAVPASVARVASSYADALMAEGDLDAAAVEVGRLSRWSDRDFDSAVLEARLYSALGRNEARQTALARARALAGERTIPQDASANPVSTRQTSAR